MKRVLVTGDRGYIGVVLSPLLVKKGFEVIGFDTEFFPYELPQNKRKTHDHKKITKDIRKVEKKDIEGVDSIIHLSALSNDPMGEISPDLTSEINFQASIRLAEIGKAVGVKRFIFSSSCSVYGGNGEIPVTEEDSVDPLTPYAKSKIDTEKTLLKMADDNFSPVILRNATVYGYSPKMRLDLVVNNLVAWAMTTGKITLLSDGKSWRPLIHVYDLARIFTMIAESDKKKIHNQVVNVGLDSQNFLISDIAWEIHRQLPDCEVVFGENASSDKRNYRVSFQKFKNIFPRFTFEMDVSKGISELVEVFSKNKLTFKDFKSKKYIRLEGIKDLLANHQISESLYWLTD